MRKIFILLLLLLPTLAWAKVPDEEDILRKTMDNESPYYHSSLMMRYKNLERLSEEEYHYLYYGYAYQARYAPMATNPALENLYATMSNLDVDKATKKDAEYIISLCTEALDKDPFSPTVLNMMVFAYGTMADKE